MQTDFFDFSFDNALIATEPLKNRTDARLMVIHDKAIQHNFLNSLTSHFKSGDVLVLNDTKVIKARLKGKVTTNGKNSECQLTLHKLTFQTSNEIHYSCFVKGSKKLAIGDTLSFSDDNATTITAYILKKDQSGQVHIAFNTDLNHFFTFIDKVGTMPLPPYIEKYRKADKNDETNYQTIFAKNLGSVAAPTASLHLTHEILNELHKKDVKIAYVTLHVGGGTFLPVKTDNIKNHEMHSEIINIDTKNAHIINQAKQSGGRVICVGTTSLRVIESVANQNGFLEAYTGETNIFIYPSYRFKLVIF